MTTDGNNGSRGVRHVIFLVHGIRTQGEWATRAAAILEAQPGLHVRPIRYGFFDTLRFLIPGPFRDKPVRRVTRLIRDELSRGPVVLSVIAHSFGTYIIGRILQAEPDLRFKRVLLCGSILPDDFEWENFGHRIAADNERGWQVVNDCGMQDIWPVLAQSVTWGYGSSGRFGFGHPRVKDRFYKAGHSGFFSEDFVRTNWLPYFTEDRIVDGVVDRPTNSLLVSLLTVLKLPILAVLGLVFLAIYMPHLFDPDYAPDSESFLAGTATPISLYDIDFGDDASSYAYDGSCDDPRFEGYGMATLTLETDRRHDATDCSALYEEGAVGLIGSTHLTDGWYDGELTRAGEVDEYTVLLSPDLPRIIELRSTDFDAYLAVITRYGAYMTNDDYESGYPDARVDIYNPEQGVYRIQVSSYGSTGTGAYTLRMTDADGSYADVSTNGELLATDTLGEDGRYYDNATFAGVLGQEVTIDMSSADFDTLLVLDAPSGTRVISDNFESGLGGDSHIVARITELGQYTVHVTTSAPATTGAYLLSITHR